MGARRRGRPLLIRMTQDQFIPCLEGALRGNPKDERAIYEGYVSFAYHMARKYGFSDDDAADVAQESMIIAFDKLRNYNPERGSFKSWLAKITIHEALRAKKKVERESARINLEQVEQTLFRVEPSEDMMDAVLPLLNPAQRELFTLYFKYGMSHQEISENLNISLGNSRIRIHRLVQRIKSIFA